MNVVLTDLILVIVVSSVIFTACMSTKGWIRVVVMSLSIAVLGAWAILNREGLIVGAELSYNEVVRMINQNTAMELKSLDMGGTQSAEGLYILTFMQFVSCAIAYYVAVIVVFFSGFIGSLLVVLPAMLTLITYNCIPDTASYIMCIVFAFAVTSLGRTNGWRKAMFISGVAAVASAAVCLIVPEHDFQRIAPIEYADQLVGSDWGAYFENAISGKAFRNISSTGLAGNNAFSGMNRGVLGNVDGIQYRMTNIFRLETIDTGSSQYIKEYVGKDYANNQWYQDDDEHIEDYLTIPLIEGVDKDSDAQILLMGSNDRYYDQIYKYQYSVKDYNGRVLQQRNAVSTNFNYYHRVFSTLLRVRGSASMPLAIPAGDEGGVTGTVAYSKRAEEQREYARSNYLDMSDDMRRVINSLIGNRFSGTTDGKDDYVEFVTNYLQDNYTYNLNPGKVPDGEDFITYFLTNSEEGYCTYFASAAVMMFRYAGIPARYVEGYVVSEADIEESEHTQIGINRYDGNGNIKTRYYESCEVDVKDTAAHAWAEIFVDGYGWLVVETTPPAGVGTANVMGTGERQYIQEEETDEKSEIQPEDEILTEDERAGEDEHSSEETVSNSSIYELLRQNREVIIVVAVVLIILATAIIVLGIRYRIRRNAFKEMQEKKDVIGVYLRLERVLSCCGYGRKALGNVDYETYGTYLQEESPICSAHDIVSIVDMVLSVKFGQAESGEDKLINTIDQMCAIIKELQQQAGKFRRMVNKYILF